MKYNTTWIKKDLLDRFLRYVRIDTTSNRDIEDIPSTPGQWDLLNLLKQELLDFGIEDVSLDSHGYLIARLPARYDETHGDKPRPADSAPSIGLMAHVDTASDVSGKDVNPQVHENYQGGDIEIGEGYVLKTGENPMLEECVGDTLITADGRTLLGADDKAGVAEIMTALKWLTEQPELEHGPLEIIFTPDEETGKGMNLFPVDVLNSKCCYTFDGGERATIEGECFNGYAAKITCTGNVVHLGIARGRLVNAVTMASQFVNLLPRNESPETTDGRYGYFAPLEIKGDFEKAELSVYLRDFESEGMERRLSVLEEIAAAVEAVFPGGKVQVESRKQYANMRDHIAKEPLIMELLEKAISETGLEPERRIIRGGTDGARLSEMGIPTPNVFTGGYNFHSRLEWASLDTMADSVRTAVNLILLWGQQTEGRI